MNPIKSVLATAVITLAATAPASALILTADYSDASVSSGIFQTASGSIQSGPGGGAIDITDAFKADIAAVFTYLQNSIKVAFNHVVTFKLENLAGTGADGYSCCGTEDANQRPNSSTIVLDSSSNSSFYADATPFDNSEYTMNITDATLGGGTVNVGRFGSAFAGSAAENRTDILTLVMHETIHSIGFGGATRFTALVGFDGAAGAPDRELVVPTALTGFASDFIIPFLSQSAHIDPFAQGNVYQRTVTSEPSFGNNDRWLLTGAEVYGLCTVLACTPDEVNPNLVGPNAVPEPGSLLLIALAGMGLIATTRRRKSLEA